MKVDEKYIAEMSSIMKLEFSSEELTELTKEINNTFSLLEQLDEIDTEGVEGTFYGAVDLRARFRPDEPVKDEEEVKALLDQAIDTENNQIKVPAILDDGEGGA